MLSKILSVLAALSLAACETPSAKPPVSVEVDIESLVLGSPCAKHSFAHGQGQAPSGYLLGVAKNYQHALCHPNPDATRPLSNEPESVRDQTDALSWYASNFRAAGMETSPPIRKLYVLMLSHGMMESSGRWCCGRDTSADNTSAETAEAGIWQTSWDSHNGTGSAALMRVWNAPTQDCLLDTFKQGISSCPSVSKNWGVGVGVEFQQRSKVCPAFAADYVAVMLRVQRKHYGPINRKMADIAPECDDMFKQIEAVTVCE